MRKRRRGEAVCQKGTGDEETARGPRDFESRLARREEAVEYRGHADGTEPPDESRGPQSVEGGRRTVGGGGRRESAERQHADDEGDAAPSDPSLPRSLTNPSTANVRATVTVSTDAFSTYCSSLVQRSIRPTTVPTRAPSAIAPPTSRSTVETNHSLTAVSTGCRSARTDRKTNRCAAPSSIPASPERRYRRRSGMFSSAVRPTTMVFASTGSVGVTIADEECDPRRERERQVREDRTREPHEHHHRTEDGANARALRR